MKAYDQIKELSTQERKKVWTKLSRRYEQALIDLQWEEAQEQMVLERQWDQEQDFNLFKS